MEIKGHSVHSRRRVSHAVWHRHVRGCGAALGARERITKKAWRCRFLWRHVQWKTVRRWLRCECARTTDGWRLSDTGIPQCQGTVPAYTESNGLGVTITRRV